VTHDSPTRAREVVGLFADRAGFEKAVAALLAAGFDRTDLSVLSSHESLDAAERPSNPWRDVVTALIGEYKVVGPLVASGVIFLTSGPVAATVAGLIGAAVSGVAVKEVLDEVLAKPHTADFERALAAGGMILWVRVEDEAAVERASRALIAGGASNVHLHDGRRPAPGSP
jgi:hypothetical protein